MLIFAGLGNPGQTYRHNRHNIGFMAVDAIHAAAGFSPWRAKFQALIAEGSLSGEKLLLVKPQIYMNNSGQSLAALLQFYKLSAGNLSVFHDEMDLSAGKIRIKTGGGSGGHNGIKSLDAHCGKNYRRVRLGIGHPEHDRAAVHNYVMGDFSKAEQQWLEPLLAAIAAHSSLLARGDTNGFMNKIFTETHDAGSKAVPQGAAAMRQKERGGKN